MDPIEETGVVIAQPKAAILRNSGFHYALVVFLVSRLVLSLWAVFILAIRPLPAEPNEVLRPYLDEPELRTGPAGLLLGPWQRFDTLHYARIARSGYAATEDSVFPFLYPLAIRVVGLPLTAMMPTGTANILAAVLVSNLAFLAAMTLLYWITAEEVGESSARRSVVYLAIFPTAFFLLAAYTESLFLVFAMSAIWLARKGRFWVSGVAGLLAALTRLTGWVMVVPLAYEYLRQRDFHWRKVGPGLAAVFLPLLGALLFLAYRAWAGMPAIGVVYRTYWYQTAGLPGIDMLLAIRQMAAGGAPFRLFFDFFCALFLVVTTIAAFRRLGPAFGLYSLMLLIFILLPTSGLKPLFSFSRYVLVFFPSFVVLGVAGRNPWVNRLIVYPSIGLYLYFSGQFLMWGWVA